jgi:secreted trypsin-like serine protease
VEYIEDPEFKYAGNNPNDPYPPMNNDFALCRLNEPVTTLEPIAINQNQNWPPLTTNNSPTLLTTIGLGTLQAGGSTPSQLQEVNVPIVSNQVCSNRYEPGDIYTPGNICAGAEQKDSCQGTLCIYVYTYIRIYNFDYCY